MISPRVWAPGCFALAFAATLLPKIGTSDHTTNAHPKARIGLVFDVGGRGDKSFNDAAYIGLMRAERKLGIEALPRARERRKIAKPHSVFLHRKISIS